MRISCNNAAQLLQKLYWHRFDPLMYGCYGNQVWRAQVTYLYKQLRLSRQRVR